MFELFLVVYHLKTKIPYLAIYGIDRTYCVSVSSLCSVLRSFSHASLVVELPGVFSRFETNHGVS
jgi:hypothetical protein